MTMEVFPSTPVPTNSYPFTVEFATIKGGPYLARNIVAREAVAFELYGVTMQWSKRPRAALMGLHNFFRRQKGAGVRFVFVDFQGWNSSPVGVPWEKVYCCVATAGQTVVPLPSTGGSSFTLYKNDVAVGGGAWSLGAGGLHAGGDQATFGSGLSEGDVITASFTGKRTIVARFVSDGMTIDVNPSDLCSTSLQVLEDRDEV